jgi:outer membrane receptor protein involved in Fe transport
VQNEKAVDPEYLVKNGNRIEDPPSQVVTYPEQDVNNSSWSANLGMLHNITEKLNFTLTAGRSFRSPSIEERYKYIDLGNLVRVGDPELSPEEGYTFDAGLSVWDSDFTLKANGYLNNFNNLVVEQPGQYIKEYESGAKDTVDALINKNVNKARIYGFDMQLSYMPTGNFVIHGSASFVRGQDIKNNTNLPLIPPLNGRLGIKYNIQKVGAINLSSVIYDEQNKVAEDEEKTNGYVLYGLSFVTKDFYFKQGSFKIYGGVENILDEKYRNHLSTNRGTLDLQPGRNFYIKLKLKF